MGGLLLVQLPSPAATAHRDRAEPGPPRPPARPADAPNESKLLQMPGKGGAFEQSAEWRERDRKLVWSIKNLKGGREHTLRVRAQRRGGLLRALSLLYIHGRRPAASRRKGARGNQQPACTPAPPAPSHRRG